MCVYFTYIYLLKEIVDVSLITTMHTLKVLALAYVGPDFDVVLDFLRCFPCLEKLYIIVSVHV